MMQTPHISCADYHTRTSYERGGLGGHHLDWGNQPALYKAYPGRDPVLLPQDTAFPQKGLWTVLAESGVPPKRTSWGLELLSGILGLTYGLTARAPHPGGDIYLRSVASAGALYPCEIYVAAPGMPGLESGLYHFSIARHGLTPLRTGDLSFAVAEALPGSGREAPGLTFFISAIYFRSAWKYRERSYRYHLLDTGHLLENLLLALKAQGLDASVFWDFDDATVNGLLGLDPQKEVCLTLCTVPGTGHSEARGDLPDLGQTVTGASRVAPRERGYPVVEQMHASGTVMPSPPEKVPAMVDRLGLVTGQWASIHPPDPRPGALGYADAVWKRRSRRNFVPSPMPKSALEALLYGLCARSEQKPPDQSRAACTGFWVGNAEGYDPGLYLLDAPSCSRTRVKTGMFTRKMAHTCLDQMWLAPAAVHFLFMSNLAVLDHAWGARGYRYAMMAAGRMGERLYLMATALGLGCCGIGAFYDTEAQALLGLNQDSRMLYLVAVGPVKGRNTG
ncbi:MAG: SagB/ThcOx family dehydrogenase [Deltaproteobacteria bacterium]|nr:SagB/ThcOx family dehydrogenase [Deltaproteobacteria bacterium]